MQIDKIKSNLNLIQTNNQSNAKVQGMSVSMIYCSFRRLIPPRESANDLSFLFLLSFFNSVFFSFRFAA